MGLIRLLLTLVLGYFIWLNIKTFLRKQERRQQTPDARKAPITVVKCLQCQIHLPEHEAIASGNQWFCCDEHRRQWQAKQG